MPEVRVIEGVFGPYAGQLLTLPSEESDQAIADLWARDRYAPDYPQMRDWTADEVRDATVKANNAAVQMWGVKPPVLSSISPATAAVGDPDLTLTATGSGFHAGSVIVFNGGVEATEFVSDTSLTTTVKPSLASGAASVPVTVRNSSGAIYLDSDPKNFAFTPGGGGGEE